MVDIKTLVQVVFGYGPIALFFSVLGYFAFCAIRLSLHARAESFHARALRTAIIACVCAVSISAICELVIVNRMLGGSPIAGSVHSGKYFLAAGRGEFVEVSRNVWLFAFWAVLVSRAFLVAAIAFCLCVIVFLRLHSWSRRGLGKTDKSLQNR